MFCTVQVKVVNSHQSFKKRPISFKGKPEASCEILLMCARQASKTRFGWCCRCPAAEGHKAGGKREQMQIADFASSQETGLTVFTGLFVSKFGLRPQCKLHQFSWQHPLKKAFWELQHYVFRDLQPLFLSTSALLYTVVAEKTHLPFSTI